MTNRRCGGGLVGHRSRALFMRFAFEHVLELVWLVVKIDVVLGGLHLCNGDARNNSRARWHMEGRLHRRGGRRPRAERRTVGRRFGRWLMESRNLRRDFHLWTGFAESVY